MFECNSVHNFVKLMFVNCLIYSVPQMQTRQNFVTSDNRPSVPLSETAKQHLMVCSFVLLMEPHDIE